MKLDLPARVKRLRLPERASVIGCSVADAERRLEGAAASSDGLLNLTYADTKRFPPPRWALEDFSAAASGGANAYTPYRGEPQVRARLAPSLERSLGINVDPERELVLTPGTQAGLFTALAATVENGDRVLLADPDYLSSERMLRFLGAVVDHVPLLRTEGGPALDLDYLEESLGRGPSLLLFSNPNNPTGAVYDEASIQRIAEIAIEGDLTVIVDQLYSRLIYDRTLFTNLIAVDGMKERCITLLGPSKTESMSGYRVGVAIAPPTITDSMEDVLSITALRAPAYAQHTLQRWLAEDEDFLSRRIADYQRLRDFTVERLSSVGVLDVYSPQGTAYMFPSVARLGLSDQEVAERLLREARVIVNPGYQFGPRGTGSFRICFAQEEGAWDAALTRMTAIFEILAKSRSTIKEGY